MSNTTDRKVISEEILEDFRLFICASDTLVFVNSEEEARCIEHILRAAKVSEEITGISYEVVLWSVTKGMHSSKREYDEDLADPQNALRYALKTADANDPRVYVMLDIHPYVEHDHITRRLLRDVSDEFKSSYNRMFCLSSKHPVPADMAADTRVYNVPKPTYDELHQLLVKRTLPTLKQQVSVNEDPEFLHQVVRTLQGLTLREAEQALSRAVVKHEEMDESILDTLLDEKKGIINRSEVLEFYPAEEGSGSIGGYGLLKSWISARGKAYGEAAQEFGCPPPKGVALLGVQGCGKSLAAKVISKEWQMPALRLDMSRLMNSLLGASESNLEKALQTAAALAPCVFFIDEIEKAFAGSGGGSQDGGTSSRMLGRILTWMQERKEPVFTVATANSIEGLPPELLRKGRFDEIFFVDLPSEEERQEIFKIHIKKVKRDPDKFALDELAQASEGFSGAEIEAAVTSALFTVFDKFNGEKNISTKSILRELKATNPLSETMKERIQSLRDWARTRCRPASQRVEVRDSRLLDEGPKSPKMGLRKSSGGGL